MENTNLPALPSTLTEKVQSNFPRITQGHALGMKLLKEIQETEIATDEDKAVATEKLIKVKAVVDKVDLLTKEVTTPLEVFLEQVKSYKKAIDYNNKTKEGNEYTRARAVIEAYDRKKADEAEKARAAAEVIRRMNVLKAEIKEGVGKRVIDMLAGQKKNIIDGMTKWEGALTLENIDASYEKLGGKVPTLNKEKWEACFNTQFMSPHKDALTPEATKAYMEELKKEFPYEQYNKDYAEIVSPIINEYRARQEQIREKLKQIKEAGEAERVRLEQQRKEELERKAAEDRKAVDEAAAAAAEAVEHQKEMDKMDAEFTAQAQTEGLETGPMKRMAAFEDPKNFLKPLAEVIGACALHPKFSGVMKRNGEEVIDAVQWWLDWFADHCQQEVKGIKITMVPKTIIRKKS